MVSLLFPDAEIKQYDTQEECLEAVAKGKVGATVIPSSKINLLNESPLTKSLSFAEMAKRQELAMFTTRGNRRAATIINKAIEQSSNILNGVVLAQNSVSEKKMTLQDVLAEYADFAIGISFVIIFVLLLLVYSPFREQAKTDGSPERSTECKCGEYCKNNIPEPYVP